MIEVLKQVVEALEYHVEQTRPISKTKEAIQAGKQAIAELESQKPVAHSVIAGALFDFMGWLTSRKERIVLSSADNASPAVEAITEFAKMRNLSLDDAKVQDWNTHPPQRTEQSNQEKCRIETVPAQGTLLPKREWVGLTDEETERLIHNFGSDPHTLLDEVDARLKARNI